MIVSGFSPVSIFWSTTLQARRALLDLALPNDAALRGLFIALQGLEASASSLALRQMQGFTIR